MFIIFLIFIIFFFLQEVLLTLSIKLINHYDKECKLFALPLSGKAIVNAFAGVSGIIILTRYDFTGLFYKMSAIALIINIIGLIDLQTGNVYLFTDLIMFAIGIFFNFLLRDLVVSEILISGSIMFFICIFSKMIKGMNWGDAEVFTVLALILGYSAFSVMFVALAIAGLLALVNCIVKRKSIFTRSPLCHCIALGYIVCVFIQ
jgi:hypothetical protein